MQKQKQECKECGGEIIHDEQTKGSYCKKCGVVIEEQGIDPGPEWRNQENKRENRKRTGAPITPSKHDWGLSTNISPADRDYRGSHLSQKQKTKFRRIRKWHKRSKGGENKSRSLKNGLGEIDRMATALGIPENTQEVSAVIFRQASNENLLPGRSLESIASASIYIACRKEKISRSFEEVNTVSRVNKNKIISSYKMVSRELSIKVPTSTPREYIPRFCTLVGAPHEIEAEAQRLQQNYCETVNISGISPLSIAAAAIYAAGIKLNMMIPQTYIEEKTEVSNYTIRSNYRNILEADEETDLSAYYNRGEIEKHPTAITQALHDVNKVTYFHHEAIKDD